ncbi:MAG: methyltransferase domain-containing protein [Bdellovibrionales bacterium]
MSLYNQFLSYIKSEDFDAAESLLASDIFDVEDQMDLLTDEDYKVLEPHWSAVNTGEDITTPLFILKKIYDFVGFKNHSTVIDLGSGHGHPGILFSSLNNNLKILGYDIVLEKVNGANTSAKKLGLNNVRFEIKDLSDKSFAIPEADYYYLYNPVNAEVADIIAEKLLKIAKKKEIQILSLAGRDIKSFKSVGFSKKRELSEIGFEILSL